MVDMEQTFSKGRIDAPAGTHLARIQKIVDLGKQLPSGKYALDANGNQKPAVTKFMITYELVDLGEGDTNPTISDFLTLSYHEKSNYSKFLKAMGIKLGEKYSFTDLLGRPLSVTLEDYTKNNGTPGVKVVGRSALPGSTGDSVKELTKDAVFFNSDAPDYEVLKSLGKGLLSMIGESTTASDELLSMLAEIDSASSAGLGQDTGDM